jgi:REP element-mobilizing transposase RayT
MCLRSHQRLLPIAARRTFTADSRKKGRTLYVLYVGRGQFYRWDRPGGDYGLNLGYPSTSVCTPPQRRNDVPPSSTRYPSRPLSYVRPGGCVIESCSNTIDRFPLLTPGPDANERIFGVMGKAAEYYGVDIHAFGFLSTHVHMIYSVDDALQMSRFQGHLSSNIARELGRLHGWKDKFWARRYRAMGVGDERGDQRDRLKYALAQAVQAGLVARPQDWPGPTAAGTLVDGEPIVGYWFNRTREYYARRKGIDFGKYDYATRYEIDLKPPPAFRDDSPEEYRSMVAEVLEEIEEEAARERGPRPARRPGRS